jgi:hypothetical protein
VFRFRVLGQIACGLELGNSRRITGVLVGIDYPGRAGWFSPPKALVIRRSAAAASRLAERRKSMVDPVESTARYKYAARSEKYLCAFYGLSSEKISRTSARIAMVGRLDQCDAHQLEPFKLALVKTELELCVGRRLLSRV